MVKLFFDDPEFDAALQRTAAAVNAASADLGELLALAAQIRVADYDDWFQKWSGLASATAEKGAIFAQRGLRVSAGKAYLRATEYWRQAIFFIRHDLDDERLQTGWKAHREAFRAAIPFLPWHASMAEIPLEGARMGAYLLRPDGSATKRPTLLAPCGFDSMALAVTAAGWASPSGKKRSLAGSMGFWVASRDHEGQKGEAINCSTLFLGKLW